MNCKRKSKDNRTFHKWAGCGMSRMKKTIGVSILILTLIFSHSPTIMAQPSGKWFMRRTALLGPGVMPTAIMGKMYVRKKLFFTRLFQAFIPVFPPTCPGSTKTPHPRLRCGLIFKTLKISSSTINNTNRESSIILIVSKTYCSSTKFTSGPSRKSRHTWCKITPFIQKMLLMINMPQIY